MDGADTAIAVDTDTVAATAIATMTVIAADMAIGAVMTDIAADTATVAVTTDTAAAMLAVTADSAAAREVQ
jgi:hypothetical protein